MKKGTLAYIVGGAVLLVIIVILAATHFSQLQGTFSSPPSSSVSPVANEQAPSSKTHLDIPANVTVPDTNSTVDATVAKPESVAIAAPDTTSKFRTFAIAIRSNVFTPSTVIVNVNDIAHINFTAVDNVYDITQPDYGFKLIIPKGQTKLLEAQYTAPGKYVFYCAACGGPDKGPVGYVIVVPK
jgi:heme/copper-type cytochrome/quinol oxidase subunit 2